MSFGNIHNFQKTVWNFKFIFQRIYTNSFLFSRISLKKNMFQIWCCILFLNIRACHWSIERVCSKRKTGCTGFIPGTRVEAQCCKAHTAGSTLFTAQSVKYWKFRTCRPILVRPIFVLSCILYFSPFFSFFPNYFYVLPFQV